MMIDVIGIRRLGSFKLEIEFSDGTAGVQDFQFVADTTWNCEESSSRTWTMRRSW